jgi:hypothetical protein
VLNLRKHFAAVSPDLVLLRKYIVPFPSVHRSSDMPGFHAAGTQHRQCLYRIAKQQHQQQQTRPTPRKWPRNTRTPVASAIAWHGKCPESLEIQQFSVVTSKPHPTQTRSQGKTSLHNVQYQGIWGSGRQLRIRIQRRN